MRHMIFRQFTIVCVAIAFAAWFGAIAIAGLAWSGIAAQGMSVTATAIMIVTLVLQLAFVLTQMLPEGRTLIKLRFCGPDAWFMVLSLTLVPGALWQLLSRLATPLGNALSFGFALPLFTSVVFMIARQIQQRAYRPLANGSAPPVA